jgi:outer membrane murein-binding lipoprotein Lpp
MLATPPAGNEQPVPNATQVSPEELGALRQGSSDNVETPAAPEATPEQPKAKEDPLSSQYATLARKERALRAQIQQFKADQAKYQAERDAYKQPEIDLSKYIDRERLKSDPLAVFADAGLSYDELTQAILSQSNVQTDPRVNAQLARMEAEIKAAREEAKALRDAQDNNQKQSYQQALNQIKGEASKLVYTDPAFEMIKATNSISDVVELIEETFKADGTLMTVEDACQAVEEHLFEEAMKLTKVKKLQQRLGQSTAQPAATTNTKQPQQTTSKTLTNGMTGQRPMSARDRAIAAMQGKLNK